MDVKEYTYDIGKYTIGVDENGEDGIGITVAKIENGEIYFLGNCYGENARCIDLLIKENQELKLELSGYRQAILNDKEMLGLKEQNQELKKQLEEREKDYFKLSKEVTEYTMKLHKNKVQQKEFVKYMNDIIEDLEVEDVDDEELKGYLIQRINIFKEILQKYKEIKDEINKLKEND